MYYLQHKIHLICHLYLNIQLLCNKFHSNCVKKGLTFLNYVCTKYHIEFNKWYYFLCSFFKFTFISEPAHASFLNLTILKTLKAKRQNHSKM